MIDLNENSMTLDPKLATKILEKLGFTNYPDITEGGLASIYQAWCQSVPFDNIRKRVITDSETKQPMPGYTSEDFFEYWLKYGTGGTCWASHGALYALLKYLGFSVCYGISTMLSHRPSLKDSPGHGTLFVNFNDHIFIVDATMLHGYPLPLSEHHNKHPVWETRVHHSDGYWCINWKPLGRRPIDCRLLDFDAPENEYPLRHERSRNNSQFDGALLIRLAGLESITGIVKGECVKRHPDGSESFFPLTHEKQQKLLIEHFKIAEEIVVRIPENCLESEK